MTQGNITKRQFLMGLVSLCVFYLLIELIFNSFTMITVDEFWFAHRIYQYKTGIPYRDFAPYKTILGYYLFLPTMLFGKGIYATLIFMKNSLAILNAGLLFISAKWLSKYFSRVAVLASLFILLFSDTVLSYSTNIRVDLFGYWFGLFALLMLLEKRYILAGILIGLGFLCTQKVIWYWAALNGAWGLTWLLFSRDKQTVKHAVIFNTIIVSIIAAYLVFWSVVTDWPTIINSVFGEAAAMYHLSWYDFTRPLFWHLIVLCNPLVFLCAPLPLISLFTRSDDDKKYQIRFFIVTFSLIILTMLVPYKQVFPYYMQVAIPVFLVLYASFADWLFDIYENKTTLIISMSAIWLLIAAHLLFIITVVATLNLPMIYTLTALIPILIGQQLATQQYDDLNTKLLLTTIVFIGIIYPSVFFFGKLIGTNNQYQKENIANMQVLLADGTDYVAGIELLFNKDQPISGMKHLIGPAVDYLYKPTAEIRKIMFPSQYEDPRATPSNIIRALQESDVKLYMHTYRLNHLPPILLNYLKEHYAHFWGSIYLYAPLIKRHRITFRIRFTGDYLIKIDENVPIIIDGKRHHSDSLIHLNKGQHVSTAEVNYRLKLYPKMNGLWLTPQFKTDNWQRFLF